METTPTTNAPGPLQIGRLELLPLAAAAGFRDLCLCSSECRVGGVYTAYGWGGSTSRLLATSLSSEADLLDRVRGVLERAAPAAGR